MDALKIPVYKEFMKMVDSIRTLAFRTNADTPEMRRWR
jgi:hypothetical protein